MYLIHGRVPNAVIIWLGTHILIIIVSSLTEFNLFVVILWHNHNHMLPHLTAVTITNPDLKANLTYSFFSCENPFISVKNLPVYRSQNLDIRCFQFPNSNTLSYFQSKARVADDISFPFMRFDFSLFSEHTEIDQF